MSSEIKGREHSLNFQAAVLPTMVIILLTSAIILLPPYLDSYVGDDFVQQWRIRNLLGKPLEAPAVFLPDWTNWYYRPLQNLWMLVNRELFGLTPAAFYLLQLSWHLAAISLLYRVARGFDIGRLGALAAAALFALNVEHQLTVDWISSIGIVAATALSLGAVAVFNYYLNSIRRNWFLVSILFLWLCALFFHETAVLLPIFLFFIWSSKPKKESASKGLLLLAIVSLIVMAGYAWLQLNRDNANLSGDSILEIDTSLPNQAVQLGHFVLQIGGGWFGLNALDDSIIDAVGSSTSLFRLTAFLAIIAVSVLFVRGSRGVRLGIVWAVLQIGFIYFVLWSTRPELLAGRHLYTAWAGVSITLGAGLGLIQAKLLLKQSNGLWRPSYGLLLILLLGAGFIVYQSVRIQQSQTSTLSLTSSINILEKQMKEILPEVSDETRVFASRFILTPSYFAPTAAVWYEEPALAGGSLETLKAHPIITSDFYLFDDDGKDLVNILPDFQDHSQSTILWREELADLTKESDDLGTTFSLDDVDSEIVAGPADERRLATCMRIQSADWHGLGYDGPISVESSINAFYYSPWDSEVRLRLIDENGNVHLLSEHTYMADNDPQWKELTASLNEFHGRKATFLFEAKPADASKQGRVCWSNPSLVVD